jgi:hypothetical protein
MVLEVFVDEIQNHFKLFYIFFNFINIYLKKLKTFLDLEKIKLFLKVDSVYIVHVKLFFPQNTENQIFEKDFWPMMMVKIKKVIIFV